MLNIKFRGNRPTGSEKIFEGFLPYLGVAAPMLHTKFPCPRILVASHLPVPIFFVYN